MPTDPRIDLIYIESGGGHRAAALALQEMIRRQQRPWRVRLHSAQTLFDSIDIIRKTTGIPFQEIYNIMLRRGWTLGTAQLIPVMHALIRALHAQQVRVLREHWTREPADLVVSLIPHYNRAIFEALATACPRSPLVTVLTDFADYPPNFWMERQPQYFVCGTPRAVEQARRLGHPASRVMQASGMILHPRYYDLPAIDRAQERSPTLQTETTTLSTLRTEEEIKALPVNGRNFAELVRFTPGVVPGQATKQNLALSQQRGNVSNSVNGSNFGDNNFLVDGLQDNNNHQGWGLINYPEMEAINQYNVVTSVPDARFGRSGASVNVAYKSGENRFHGTLFEYLRNSAMDARNYFAAGPKPPLKRNNFGGVFSGPIGGRNARTFFLLSYEGQHARQGLTFLGSVPSSPMREGDFSQLLTASRPTVIYDPLTTRANPAGAGVTRDPFPGNRIPTGRFNPAAKKLGDLYPTPNLPGLAANFC